MTILSASALPERFEDVEHLDEVMTRPSEAVVEDMGRLDGDILILGASGQLGQTICGLAKRAAPDKRIIGVARFGQPGIRDRLNSWGVETVTCDLLDRTSVANLPRIPNVVYAVGGRFGPVGDRELAWMTNTCVPGNVAESFVGCRMVIFSSGTVYPLFSIHSQGATEDVAPRPAADEFANSCLARERIFQYFWKKHDTPGCIIRLAYANEIRYGIMQFIARKVYANEALDLNLGHSNVIWQGDVASQVLRAFHHCTTPMTPINVTGPETMSRRDLAGEFGRIFGKEPRLEGSEADKVWLMNSGKATRLFGYPVVSQSRMTHWIADWVARGMPYTNTPFPGQIRWPIQA